VKFIKRENIDIEKWDALVKSSPENAVFSLSAYLDAVAENWCIYSNDNYSKGIAVPFTVRLGNRICYTPIFLRYLEWFGEEGKEYLQFLNFVKEEFKQGNICLKNKVDEHFSKELIYQRIEPENTGKYNTLAKRMISKFDHSELKIIEVDNQEEILKIIREELPKKVSSINDLSLNALENLIVNLKTIGFVKMIGVNDKGSCMGGLFLVEFNDSVLYLKGGFTENVKKLGAMYAIMDKSIRETLGQGKTFDFGGSRVEGVRRFNVNLGGIDSIYYSYEWDNAPKWFKLLKKARNAWKRK